MHIVQFIEPIMMEFRKSAGGIRTTFEAGRDYLITSHQTQNLLADKQIMQRARRISNVDSRIPNFYAGGRRLGRQGRVLLFNGGGGYGDQIMTWPVAQILSLAGFEVHAMADPGNTICWWNLPFIKSIVTVPAVWEHIKMFDHLAFFENVSNQDEHPDQEHPVDTMLRKVGIDPNSVDPELKVAKPVFTPNEQASTAVYNGKQIALYQLASANPIRNLPADTSVALLQHLSEAFPEYHWIALFDEFVAKNSKVVDMASQLKLPNMEVKNFGNLRELWAATSVAKVVVGPDSMMVHVAGSLSVPCVGLWGPVAPDRRVRYYKRHIPLYSEKACPNAPCFHYSGSFPRYCPPRPPQAPRNCCELLAAVSFEDVVSAIYKATSPASLCDGNGNAC